MALIKHSIRTKREGCKHCGSTEIYWAHDTDVPGMACKAREDGKTQCANPGVAGKFTLINKDGTRHECLKDKGNGEASSASTPSPATPASVPAGLSALAPKLAPSNGVSASPDADRLNTAAMLLDALSPKVDAAEVRKLIGEQHDSFASDLLDMVDAKIAEIKAPVTVKIEAAGETRTIEGAHRILPTLIKIVGSARKHLMMVGPAGTGKSHLAGQIAEALGLPYFEISLSPAMSPTALLGYMQAEGKYVGTLFRQAFEHGGVFHFDEFDNGHPSVMAVINASLANGHAAFPDGMVKRHPDFRCVASANTYGRGPDRVYTGRQAMDGSTLNRFAVVPVDIDEALEEKICQATGADDTVVREVLRYVRGIRKNAETHKLALIFGPRESEGMCALIVAGLSVHEAIEYRVRKGISDTDWSKATSNVSLPNL